MLETATAYPIKRLALKVAILAAFGLLQWRSGVLRRFALLFVISGSMSLCLAVVYRSRILCETRFTYWDEAAVFPTIGALAASRAE